MSRGGRPRLSVSNSPCGPCGRKATVEEEEEEKKIKIQPGQQPNIKPAWGPRQVTRIHSNLSAPHTEAWLFCGKSKNGMVRRYDIVPLLDQDEEYSR